MEKSSTQRSQGHQTQITVKTPVFTAMAMRAQNIAIYGHTDNDRQEKKEHLVLVVCHSRFPRD